MRAAALLLLLAAWAAPAAGPLRLATFSTDATPPLGTPLCHGSIKPAATVVDPLSARGVVVTGAGAPIVLCAVDWVGIGNASHDRWREALARAAGTTPDRVAVHTVHQHDTPGSDVSAEALLSAHGYGGRMTDEAFCARTMENTAAALKRALAEAHPLTHVGIGKARVEQVASNRRLLGPDGKVKWVRLSSCKDPEARSQPEGVVDPWVRLVSFWNGERPLAAVTYYATHPQSYYGQGGVSADFVGMARAERERALPGVFHLHFNGASGNVAAGKYNDGSPENRPVLAARLAAGMKGAWEATVKHPLRASDVGWRIVPVALPVSERLKGKAALERTLADSTAVHGSRVGAARALAWLARLEAGRKIDLTLLRLGRALIVHMPGELFVEYQLAAARMRPEDFLAMAAYGDYAPGYIGTKIAYSQGGYETGPPSRTAPEVETVLMESLARLLR